MELLKINLKDLLETLDPSETVILQDNKKNTFKGTAEGFLTSGIIDNVVIMYVIKTRVLDGKLCVKVDV